MVVRYSRSHLIRSRSHSGREALLETIDGCLDFGLDTVVESFFRGDILQDRGIVGFDELQKFLFEAPNFRDRARCRSRRWSPRKC